jgi:hypothetical protein
MLLINLPPTDPAPLADYLPYLNLLRELLREHADQILPHLLHWNFSGPAHIWSFSQHPLLSSSMGSPSGSTSQGTVRKMEKGVGGLLESSREEHFTVVLLANAHPNAYVSYSPILKLPPLCHTTCLLLLIKN